MAAEIDLMLLMVIQSLTEVNIGTLGLPEDQALKMLYCSKLFKHLAREETKLWHLSELTLFQMFCEEQDTGKITYTEKAG
jgi:hypothetical protein